MYESTPACLRFAYYQSLHVPTSVLMDMIHVCMHISVNTHTVMRSMDKNNLLSRLCVFESNKHRLIPGLIPAMSAYHVCRILMKPIYIL